MLRGELLEGSRVVYAVIDVNGAPSKRLVVETRKKLFIYGWLDTRGAQTARSRWPIKFVARFAW